MNSPHTSPQNTDRHPRDERDCHSQENHFSGHQHHDHESRPARRGHGFSPRAFGPGGRYFAGRPEPRKSDIRLMKRVGRIVQELRNSRATSTKEQRATAVATLEATAVELKRIFAS